MPFADSAEIKIHYQISGTGNDVLMLLPQSVGPRGNDALIGQLSSAHRVIHYDQRGTGASSAWSELVSMQQQADDATAVLQALSERPAHVLAHSTGCGIAVALACAYPQYVASLSLISPWTWGDPYLSEMQQLRITAARALDPIAYARFNAALLYPPEYRRAHQAAFEQLAQAAQSNPHDATRIAQRLTAILAYDARPSLPSLKIPSVVIAARDDQLMPSWFATEAAGLLPSAELHLTDGGGHMLLETRADDIAQIVLPHLASVDA